MQDTPRFITRSAVRFFSGTMLSRITGLLRDMVMAGAFGTDPSTAAFLAAFRFSHLLRRMFGEGALQSAFIPQFEKLKSADPDNAYQFFKKLYLILSIFLILLIIGGMAFLKTILYFAAQSLENKELINLTFLMLPSLLFICLSGLNAGLLQSEKKYFIPAAAPCAFNALWIFGALSLSKFPPAQAMPWLSGWIIAACLGQWLVTLPNALSFMKKTGIKSLKPPLFSAEIKNFIKPLMLGIAGVSATQVNSALDSIFAWYADREGPAFLWYAIRLQQLPIGLFGVALSSALLPPLSRALSKNDLTNYRFFLEHSLLKCWELMLPATLAIYLVGEASINLIYGRGDFNQLSIAGTYRCLAGYGFGLIPTCLVLILSPAFYANQDFRLPTIVSLLSVFLNIGLNACFIFGFDFGAESVAWSTSLASWFNASLLAFFLFKKMGIRLSHPFYRSVIINVLASAVGAMVVIAAKQWRPGSENPLFFEKLSNLIYLCLAFGIGYLPFYGKKLLRLRTKE